MHDRSLIRPCSFVLTSVLFNWISAIHAHFNFCRCIADLTRRIGCFVHGQWTAVVRLLMAYVDRRSFLVLVLFYLHDFNYILLTRPQAELWGPSSAGLESWPLASRSIAGEIRLKSAGLPSRLKLAFSTFLHVPGAVGTCGTKTAINLNSSCIKCRLLVLLASLTQQCIWWPENVCTKNPGPWHLRAYRLQTCSLVSLMAGPPLAA